MKILTVGDQKTNMGFKLAGVGECLTPDIDTKELRLKLKDPELGLVILTTSAYQKYREIIEHTEQRKKTVTPIFMRIPEYGKKDTEADDIDLLIKKALGIKIGGLNE